MARDEDDDDSLPLFSESTVEFPEQAKLGQARNFLLVCKRSTAHEYTAKTVAKEIV